MHWQAMRRLLGCILASTAYAEASRLSHEVAEELSRRQLLETQLYHFHNQRHFTASEVLATHFHNVFEPTKRLKSTPHKARRLEDNAQNNNNDDYYEQNGDGNNNDDQNYNNNNNNDDQNNNDDANNNDDGNNDDKNNKDDDYNFFGNEADERCSEFLVSFLEGTTDARDTCEGIMNAYTAAGKDS